MAYTPEKGDAESRTRFLVGDVSTTSPRFTPAEVELALRETWIEDFASCYQDADHSDGPTAATVNIVLGATLQAQFRRTLPGPTADDLDLNISAADSVAYDQIWELIKYLTEDTDKGWVFALGGAGQKTILTGGGYRPDRYKSKSKLRANLKQRTHDLALTGSALPCLGVANAKRLPLYRPRFAAIMLLESWLGREEAGLNWREGKVEENWQPEAVEKRLADLRGLQLVAVR